MREGADEVGPRAGGLRCAVLLAAAYAALVAWFTWPLAARAGSAMPCTLPVCLFDGILSFWALAWETRALVTAPLRLAEANIYHPAPHALFYGHTGLAALPYFAPVYLASGNAVLASNVAFLTALTLTLAATHAAVRRWTGSHLAGLVAAWMVLLNRWYVWGFVATAPHLAVLQYFPPIILLAATPPATGRGWGLLLALVVAQCLTDPMYFTPAVLLPLALVATARLVRPAARPGAVRLLGVVVAGAALVAAASAGYLVIRADNPALATQSLWRSGAVFPDSLRARLVAPGSPASLPLAMWAFLAAGAAAFLVPAARGRAPAALRRGWAQATLWSAVAIVIGLAPFVTVGGTLVALPQAWVTRWVPLYDFIRTPSRLAVAAVPGLALLGGLAFAQLGSLLPAAGRWRRAGGTGRAAMALGVGLVMWWPHAGGLARPPYPLVPTPGPSEFTRLVSEMGGPLLELPIGPDGMNPNGHAFAMYRSLFHWQPLLDGYASFWPAGFRERMALAVRLPDRAALDALVRRTGLRLVWVHLNALRPYDRVRWERGATPGLRRIAADADNVLFAVEPRAGA